MKVARLVFSTAAIFALAACSMSTLRVDSQPPGVDVFVAVGGESPRKLGVTPLSLSEETIGAHGQPFQLTVSKEGFLSENVLVGPTIPPRATDIKVALKAIPKGVDEEVLQRVATNAAQTQRSVINEEVLQKVASGVAQTLRFLSSKQYDQAEQALGSLISQYPSIPTFHELMGNIHYLKKDLAKALVYYKKALELNPSNYETQRMVQKIETIHGTAAPSERLPSATERSR